MPAGADYNAAVAEARQKDTSSSSAKEYGNLNRTCRDAKMDKHGEVGGQSKRLSVLLNWRMQIKQFEQGTNCKVLGGIQVKKIQGRSSDRTDRFD